MHRARQYRSSARISRAVRVHGRSVVVPDAQRVLGHVHAGFVRSDVLRIAVGRRLAVGQLRIQREQRQLVALVLGRRSHPAARRAGRESRLHEPRGAWPGGGSGDRCERTAIALFNDADVARLKPGMAIQLDVQLQTRDRYGGSSQRYGQVEGRILTISPASADPAEVSRTVGDSDVAVSLMTRSRQAAYGEGGDPTATMGEKLTDPVRLVTVAVIVMCILKRRPCFGTCSMCSVIHCSGQR